MAGIRLGHAILCIVKSSSAGHLAQTYAACMELMYVNDGQMVCRQFIDDDLTMHQATT